MSYYWEKLSNQTFDTMPKFPDCSGPYTIDDYGFRNSFDIMKVNKPIVALGCSHTFGLGVHENKRWSNLLQKHLDYPVVNMGIIGATNDTIYRVVKKYKNYLSNAKLIILLSPNNKRIELWKNNNPIQLRPTMWNNNRYKTLDKDTLSYYKEFIDDDMNSELNREKNILSIKQILEVPIKVLTVEKDWKIYDTAGDGLHGGEITHQSFLDSYISQNHSTTDYRY